MNDHLSIQLVGSAQPFPGASPAADHLQNNGQREAQPKARTNEEAQHDNLEPVVSRFSTGHLQRRWTRQVAPHGKQASV